MDLIMKHDQAFNWNQDDETMVKSSKAAKKRLQTTNYGLPRREKDHNSDDNEMTPEKENAIRGGGAVP